MTTTAPAARQATYREVFAEPRFRLLFLTRSLAIGADTLRTVALSVLIFAATGSPLLAAMTYGAAFLPQAIGGTLLGALADRARPRPLITAGYGLEAATAAVLALTRLPAGASLALVAVIATVTPVFGGASSRLIAEALDGDAYVLGRSLANIATSAAQVLGLAAGGVAVAALGARHALLVTAACHLAAAVAVRVRLPGLPAAARPPGRLPVSVLRQSWTVNRQLIADRAVRNLLLATWLPPAFLAAAESLIVPYAAQHRFPASSPGLILACVPAGMIAGDFAAGRLLRPAARERLTIPLMMLIGLPLLGFAAGPPLPATAGLLAVTGIGPAYVLGIQRRFLNAVPPPVLGQAFGLLSTGLMTFQGAGPALFGAVAQSTSPGPAMALAGVAIIMTAAGLRPALRTATGSRRRSGRGAAEDDEVVAVHDLPLIARALPGGEPVGGPAHQRRDLGRVVVDQAARDDLAVGTGQVDRVARVETPLHPGDPRGQQGCLGGHDRPDRARVQHQRAPGRGGVRQP
jgi:predicted MFS family arabinose efflux permease